MTYRQLYDEWIKLNPCKGASGESQNQKRLYGIGSYEAIVQNWLDNEVSPPSKEQLDSLQSTIQAKREIESAKSKKKSEFYSWLSNQKSTAIEFTIGDDIIPLKPNDTVKQQLTEQSNGLKDLIKLFELSSGQAGFNEDTDLVEILDDNMQLHELSYIEYLTLIALLFNVYNEFYLKEKSIPMIIDSKTTINEIDSVTW